MTPSIVSFVNSGEIDPLTITTIGVSVKEGENPFGVFGTGLKYSIAILLRTHHSVSIWSGLKEYVFTVKTEKIRKRPHDLVCMNGTPLGFTTHLGHHWEIWQAYRELYCNAQDEGGEVQEGRVLPEAGKTVVVVMGEEFAQVHEGRGSIILQESPVYASSACEIIDSKRLQGTLFYRKIKVGTFASSFTYNIKSLLKLTEDRTPKSIFEVEWAISNLWSKCEDAELCARLAASPMDSFEGTLSFNFINLSSVLLDQVAFRGRDKGIFTNPSLLAQLEKERPEVVKLEECELSKIQAFQLARAIEVNVAAGFPVTVFPIVPVAFLGTHVSGLAKQKTIYISLFAFEQGTKEVARTLCEEYLHLYFDVRDETRAMQNILFNKMFGFIEEYVWKEAI